MPPIRDLWPLLPQHMEIKCVCGVVHWCKEKRWRCRSPVKPKVLLYPTKFMSKKAIHTSSPLRDKSPLGPHVLREFAEHLVSTAALINSRQLSVDVWKAPVTQSPERLQQESTAPEGFNGIIMSLYYSGHSMQKCTPALHWLEKKIFSFPWELFSPFLRTKEWSSLRDGN